ncbi:winged helix-turn-helix domain-containing protein [Aeromonas sanarellii]|uniref:winged helix-turn-helix domain-containing protein n=1 Tax=Aeromonas sanarellii TaxID=633415 RepID=UPI003B9DD72D
MSDCYIQLTHKEKDVTIDLELGVVRIMMGDFTYRTIKIGKRERELLLLLVQKRGLVVSKEDMLVNVWKNSIVGENTVVVALSNVRKIFKKVDNECSCLITVSGKGYIFYPERSGFVVEAKSREEPFLI